MIWQLFLVILVLLTSACAEESKSSQPTTDTPVIIEGNPKVLMTTSVGDITLELYPEKAPKTVANFLEYVNNGFYNGTVFHRVINNFMIQGGGFDSSLKKKSTNTPIENEADNGLANDKGTIAMARTSNPHSATSQFFINHVDNGFLNFSAKTSRGWGYTVFGKVIEGIEVVDQIAHLPTGSKPPFTQDVPMPLVIIEEMKIIE